MTQDLFGPPGSLLVLGGSSAIGTSIAAAMVRRGTRSLILAGRDEGALGEAAVPLGRQSRVEVATRHYDALARDRRKLLEAAVGGGELDAAVVALGAYASQADVESGAAAADELHEVNCAAPAQAVELLGARMAAQGQGTIVVLSSAGAPLGRPHERAYAESKARLEAACRRLGPELGRSNVRVVLVRPGFVRTKMTAGLRPPPWATTPDAVAASVLRGLDRGRQLIWAPRALGWVVPAAVLLRRAAGRA